MINVAAYSDPEIEAIGYDPAMAYCETFWLPILGPSALWALRRLTAGLSVSPDGYDVPVVALAGELGLPGRGRTAPIVRTLARLVTFDFAGIAGDRYHVRTALPPLSARHTQRLPAHLAAQLIVEGAGR